MFLKKDIEVVDAWHMLFAIEHRELTTTTREHREELSSSEGNGDKASREPVLSCDVAL